MPTAPAPRTASRHPREAGAGTVSTPDKAQRDKEPRSGPHSISQWSWDSNCFRLRQDPPSRPPGSVLRGLPSPSPQVWGAEARGGDSGHCFCLGHEAESRLQGGPLGLCWEDGSGPDPGDFHGAGALRRRWAALCCLGALKDVQRVMAAPAEGSSSGPAGHRIARIRGHGPGRTPGSRGRRSSSWCPCQGWASCPPTWKQPGLGTLAPPRIPPRITQTASASSSSCPFLHVSKPEIDPG